MNTQAIKDELLQFVYANFDSADVEILQELSEIFIQSHLSAIRRGANRTMAGLIMNLDLVINFMGAKRRRSEVYTTILDSLHSSLIAQTVVPCRGGVSNVKCDIVFPSFDAFLHACLALKTKRHKQFVAFSVKCTSMVVRLYAAIQEDLKKTKAQLAEEKAQVQRRVFLVIKEAVREYRKENGYRYTDSKWRLKNFGECCRRLTGITYKIGATPYVQREYLQNAHLAIKKYYKVCQQNELMEQPSYQQKKMPNYYDLV